MIQQCVTVGAAVCPFDSAVLISKSFLKHSLLSEKSWFFSLWKFLNIKIDVQILSRKHYSFSKIMFVTGPSFSNIWNGEGRPATVLGLKSGILFCLIFPPGPEKLFQTICRCSLKQIKRQREREERDRQIQKLFQAQTIDAVWNRLRDREKERRETERDR